MNSGRGWRVANFLLGHNSAFRVVGAHYKIRGGFRGSPSGARIEEGDVAQGSAGFEVLGERVNRIGDAIVAFIGGLRLAEELLAPELAVEGSHNNTAARSARSRNNPATDQEGGGGKGGRA